jgi:hypothetical protein
VLGDAVGHVEGLVLRPAIRLLGGDDRVGTKRFAVSLLAVRLGAAPADDRVDDDEGGSVVGRLEAFDCPRERLSIVGVVDVEHVPTIGLEALAHILGEGEVGMALDADTV